MPSAVGTSTRSRLEKPDGLRDPKPRRELDEPRLPAGRRPRACAVRFRAVRPRSSRPRTEPRAPRLPPASRRRPTGRSARARRGSGDGQGARGPPRPERRRGQATDGAAVGCGRSPQRERGRESGSSEHRQERDAGGRIAGARRSPLASRAFARGQKKRDESSLPEEMEQRERQDPQERRRQQLDDRRHFPLSSSSRNFRMRAISSGEALPARTGPAARAGRRIRRMPDPRGPPTSWRCVSLGGRLRRVDVGALASRRAGRDPSRT